MYYPKQNIVVPKTPCIKLVIKRLATLSVIGHHADYWSSSMQQQILEPIVEMAVYNNVVKPSRVN